MPRRLGDDPLTRKRKKNQNATSATATDNPRTSVAEPESHNDVFFTRRTEGSSSPAQQEMGPNRGKDAPSTSEIAEVSDIVRIAEVAQSASNTVATVEPAPPAAKDKVPAPTAPSKTDDQEVKAEPRPSDGFFRRLFRRFGK